MQGYHWGLIVLVLVIGYMLGVFMPGPGVALRGKIGV
jgi:hypothetical protein